MLTKYVPNSYQILQRIIFKDFTYLQKKTIFLHISFVYCSENPTIQVLFTFDVPLTVHTYHKIIINSALQSIR